MSDVLQCNRIGKKFKDKEALKDVTFSLEKGKIYGMIGRNGAGKTTLLSVMSGQSRATVGEVTLDGAGVWENQASIDRICFSREINPLTLFGPNNMKVKELLKLAGIYYTSWDVDMADRLVKLFELDVKKRISKMSKGMLSMVTIIIAMASKAEFTFLDEPVAGLDVVAREEFYKLLLEEYEESGRTFVISTHIIEEAQGLFEEVIVMKEGKMILKENTLELLDRSFHISGPSEQIDEWTQQYKSYQVESIGRSKSATIVLEPGQSLMSDDRIVVQPVNLQNLFVSLCGRE